MKKSIKILSILLVAVICLALLVACNNQTFDKSKYYDDVTKTLKLVKSFEGKSFLTEGIGRATLISHTDGDTSRFRLESGEEIAVRYYQIDTPESTGNVEKWGKAASLFVKDRLLSATEIVLEATKTKAEKDSYGTRYLGYVWYKTADYPEFKLLNLEVVENGFSANQGNVSSSYPYNDYFAKAEKFARENQLRVFSEDEDPLYSTKPQDITLKEFYENTEIYYNPETESGAKIRFTACLVELRVSSSGTYTYTAEWYDEDGERYTINIYAGYSSSSASRMKLGHLYTIIGSVAKHYGDFQVSGIAYDDIYGSSRPDEYTNPVQSNYFLRFDSTRTWRSNDSMNLYGDVTVVSTTLEGTTLTIVGTANQKTQTGYKDTATTFTFKVEVPESFNNTIQAGDTFSTNGYQYEAKSGIITVLSYSNIVFN